ncbi:MAG TPA: peptide deformylase [Candidatus Paceibacterota bacterium]|nr:peptide deformylase [Candidatus Paceibacterota bacterium]
MKDHIVQVGDPVLRAVAKPVLKKDIGSRKLNAVIAKMKKLLDQEEFGVAIAAPQVGESLRLFVVAGRVFMPAADEEDGTREVPPARVFINPKITRLSRGKKEMSEGCLSVRDKYGSVMRHEKATVEALDEKGRPFIYHGSGLIGHIFQHEVDHLDGVLYIDKTVTLEEDEGFKKLGERRRKGDK